MTLTKADLFNCSDEIAGCIEKAYEQIQFSEATRVLFFSSPKKMTDYAKKVSLFSFGNQACSQIQILWGGDIRFLLWKHDLKKLSSCLTLLLLLMQMLIKIY